MSGFDPKNYWEQRLATSTGLEGVGYLGLGQPFNEWMYRVRRWNFKRFVAHHMPQRAQRTVPAEIRRYSEEHQWRNWPP